MALTAYYGEEDEGTYSVEPTEAVIRQVDSY